MGFSRIFIIAFFFLFVFCTIFIFFGYIFALQNTPKLVYIILCDRVKLLLWFVTRMCLLKVNFMIPRNNGVRNPCTMLHCT